jgi:hypothetical protein
MHAHSGSPCSGLCSNPVSIDVPDGTTYSTNFGASAPCLETTSELVDGDCQPAGRDLFVNGRKMQCNGQPWALPLPSQRHHGYCFQGPAGPPNSLSLNIH